MLTTVTLRTAGMSTCGRPVRARSSSERAAKSPSGMASFVASSRCTYAGRQSTALLMKRVFAIDVEVCKDCGAHNTRIDFFTTRDAIEKELRNRGPPIQVDLPRIAA